MLRSEKSKCVSELEEVYKNSGSIIITRYHGLTVSQITSLRRALKSEGANFKVVKNTLSKIAADRTGLEKASVFLSGPTAIAYSTDPVAAAKTVVEFAKTNEKLKVVGGIVNNQFFDADEINHIAKLPSLNELRGKIVGILQAPATKIAGVLQTPASAVARVLQAYSDK